MHATQVRFLFDPTIFTTGAMFDAETIRLRLRELAFLNPSACILYRCGACCYLPFLLCSALHELRELICLL